MGAQTLIKWVCYIPNSHQKIFYFIKPKIDDFIQKERYPLNIADFFRRGGGVKKCPSVSKGVKNIFTYVLRYLTLHENSPLYVTLEVCTICPSSEIQETCTLSHLNPNLEPTPWDVDMDMIGSSGLQFDAKHFGDHFDVVIRINAENGALVTFSLKIWYDPEVLLPTECYKMGAWSDKNYEENGESTPGEILLVGEYTFMHIMGPFLYHVIKGGGGEEKKMLTHDDAKTPHQKKVQKIFTELVRIQ